MPEQQSYEPSDRAKKKSLISHTEFNEKYKGNSQKLQEYYEEMQDRIRERKQKNPFLLNNKKPRKVRKLYLRR